MPLQSHLRIARRICIAIAVASLLLGVSTAQAESPDAQRVPPQIRVGIIGLDTSHVLHFTNLLNADSPPPEFAGCRIVAAYPHGSRDIASSVSRVPEYSAKVKQQGVEIVDSIDALLERVDAVMLESNDGRPHLEQALPVLKARKRLFIDKPMAGSLADVIAIFEAAEHFGAPVFSSSSLRYGKSTVAVRGGAVGQVLACDVYSPCSLEKTHPDLFWYGIHGVEALYAVMGVGCQSVTRTHSENQDMAVGTWEDGRIGSFRGMRVGAQAYGGMAFGATGNQAVGAYDGYEPLVADIVRFFRGGEPAVTPQETIELFAFMEAADESKKQRGAPVEVPPLIEKARDAAAKRRSW